MAQIETELQLLKPEVINMWSLVNSQLSKARLAGLDEESIEALFRDTFRLATEQGVA